MNENGRKMPVRTLRLFFPLSLLLLAILPTSLLDDLPVVCPYRNLFGMRCLGCGMTHAISLLLHFRPAEAFAWNPLVAIAFPWLAALAVRELRALGRLLRQPGSPSQPEQPGCGIGAIIFRS